MKRIYLDYNASTPLDPQVLKVLVQELNEEEGNPSSIHFHGRKCRNKLEQSRENIARFFQVKPHEIIFTSGGTEGAALLLKGFMMQHDMKGHIISSGAEHSCVFRTLKELEKRGAEVSFLSPGLWGAVRPEEVESAIRPNTRMMTFMAANNETGVITDIDGIAAVAYRAGIPFIVDGVALLGKEMFRIPPGVSALFF